MYGGIITLYHNQLTVAISSTTRLIIHIVNTPITYKNPFSQSSGMHKYTPSGTIAMHVVSVQLLHKYACQQTFGLENQSTRTCFDGIHIEICPGIVFSFSYSVMCYYRCTRKALHMCCTAMVQLCYGSN